MRMISYNVNGIRSAIKRGFLEWLKTDPAEIICLQETKAEKANIDLRLIEELGYHTYWFSAEKKGYSGVAIFSKIQPDQIFYGNGMNQSDREGRVIRADFKGLTLINAYFPSGTSGELRQSYKYQWLNEFSNYIGELQKERKKIIVCGDFNIAHHEIDIHNPSGNKKSSGFLPEERKWLTQFIESGMIDTFRELQKEPHHYSWWSQRFPSVRVENKGWRIDYFMLSKTLKSTLRKAAIYPDVKHSDHCPVFIELEI
ncbi:MAG: exodeoxyribonuclease III [Bacteroidetes bacterium]|nr:exodeoxyribonuclease III [Bacteroidota bacterium]MBS1741062.1 exodeoxyribonuclease III [Bacteroidota bacterium]